MHNVIVKTMLSDLSGIGMSATSCMNVCGLLAGTRAMLEGLNPPVAFKIIMKGSTRLFSAKQKTQMKVA